MLIALSACQQPLSVRVETSVPDALVETLPITCGVVFEATLRDHVYREDSEHRERWSIATGPSQVTLFQKVLNAICDELQVVDAHAEHDFDVLITPIIDEVQFSLPRETGFEYFEAWFNYHLKLAKVTGEDVLDWHFAGYGKAPGSRFGTIAQGIEQAAQDAIRDAGAKLSTGLLSDPEVSQWLSRSP